MKTILCKDEYTEKIYTILFMLETVGDRMIQFVKNLAISELDYRPQPDVSSIGVLIMHITSLEYYYQLYTFAHKRFESQDAELWNAALSISAEAKKEFKEESIDFYLEIYHNVRQRTFELFKKVEDTWLEQVPPNSQTTNHYGWLHVMEHQSQHLGQIYMLKRMYDNENKVDKRN